MSNGESYNSEIRQNSFVPMKVDAQVHLKNEKSDLLHAGDAVPRYNRGQTDIFIPKAWIEVVGSDCIIDMAWSAFEEEWKIKRNEYLSGVARENKIYNETGEPEEKISDLYTEGRFRGGINDNDHFFEYDDCYELALPSVIDADCADHSIEEQGADKAAF